MTWYLINTYFNYLVPLLQATPFLKASLKMDCKDLYMQALKCCYMSITHTLTQTQQQMCAQRIMFFSISS